MKRIFLLIFLLQLTGCTSLFYQPDRFMYYDPAKLGLEKKEIKFQSRDNTELTAWVFDPPRGTKLKGTLVQFHGNAQNISSHYLALVWVTEFGYRLLTFDYRGYGASDGTADKDGVYLDSLAALDWAWGIHQADKNPKLKFITHGQSLGGAVLMRALQDFPHRDQVDLVVMDSTFMSYKTVASQVLRKHWLTWLFSPLAYVLVSNRYESSESVVAQKRRLLVVHDERDPVVPFSNGQEIHDKATCPKEFWKLDKGFHIGAFSKSSPENRKKFIDLLDGLQGR